MRTVELLVDEETEERVREVWRRLGAAGLPSLASHRHPTNRPHLTLATTTREIPPATWYDLSSVLTALPLPLALTGVLRFSGRTEVLAWRVAAEAGLAALHRRVWTVLHGDDASGANPLHAPGAWTPHLTLGRTRGGTSPWPEERLPAELSEAWRGTFTGARSYDSATRTVTPLR
ncbi:2'-5' RNA ligase family protein [Streptomyces sp. NPDC003717]|uniref:2'-5' RNA ligase family protein n=1 Tax=Streptomyces sp. NPDC003717 TaxID=3154276 RepID=UPI0033BA5AA3